MNNALSYLLALVNAGAEYPDAEWKASEKFKVDAAKLRAAYDDDAAYEAYRNSDEYLKNLAWQEAPLRNSPAF